MNGHSKQICVSAPGRICLFGEHQDYLGLSVITMAIDLRITIEGTPVTDKCFFLEMPDVQRREMIDFTHPPPYEKERDYFRSGINVIGRLGKLPDHGYRCTVRGNIPINSGTSSSSAMMVAWIAFLLAASGNQSPNPEEVALLAFRAEVEEFNEPGGMMDHFAASLGEILHLNFADPLKAQRLPVNPGRFVLGDSREPKDTKGFLNRVKTGTLEAMQTLREADPALNIRELTLDSLIRHAELLNSEQKTLLSAHIKNRELARQAYMLLSHSSMNRNELGSLLNLHQEQLRDGLRISTPKIDSMIEAALNAGALGAKINGSGGGGCMFAYAPENPEPVAEAITRAGGVPFITGTGKGLHIEIVNH